MLELLQNEARRNGDRLGAISVMRLGEVKADFDRIGVDTSPYYNFNTRDDLGFTAQTVLIVVSPSPVVTVAFHMNGNKKTVLIPPTYVDATERPNQVQQYLTDFMATHGYNIAYASNLPGKPLAVHAGVGTYGRNNIVYAEGMGSFITICRYFTDWECDNTIFEPMRWADACADCTLCASQCPTGALSANRDTVDSDRCLTALNEHGGDFPEWVSPDWHHALIGCIKCQFVCPMNKDLLSVTREVASFDEEETKSFLNGTLPEEKLSPLGPDFFRSVLPRNLSMLLSQ